MPSRVRAPARASTPARNTSAKTPAAALPRVRKPWRRITYTPEGLAELRRLYEETLQSDVAIATSYNISAPTLRAKAKEQGWIKYRPPPIDVPPSLRLAAEAARLVQQQERIESRAIVATPTPDPPSLRFGEASPSPPLASLAGEGEKPAAGGGENAPADDAENGDPLPAFRATVETAIGEANRLLAALKLAREQMQESGEYGRATQLARDLSHISTSLHRLGIILRGGAVTQDQFDDDSDIPPDLDAFRDELARRIDALVDAWIHEADGEQRGSRNALPSDA